MGGRGGDGEGVRLVDAVAERSGRVGDGDGEGVERGEGCGEVDGWGEEGMMVFGLDEVVVAGDGGGEVFVAVVGGGGDGE